MAQEAFSGKDLSCLSIVITIFKRLRIKMESKGKPSEAFPLHFFMCAMFDLGKNFVCAIFFPIFAGEIEGNVLFPSVFPYKKILAYRD